LYPDHATIARFRARHEEALGGLFSQVLRLLAGNQTTGNDCLRQMGVSYLRGSHMRLGQILASAVAMPSGGGQHLSVNDN
jgi:hypothetical protein